VDFHRSVLYRQARALRARAARRILTWGVLTRRLSANNPGHDRRGKAALKEKPELARTFVDIRGRLTAIATLPDLQGPDMLGILKRLDGQVDKVGLNTAGTELLPDSRITVPSRPALDPLFSEPLIREPTSLFELIKELGQRFERPFFPEMSAEFARQFKPAMLSPRQNT